MFSPIIRSTWPYLIDLLTAIGLSPGGSTHLHTNNTQNNTNNNGTTQITTNVEECGPCPVFASFTLAFALQLRKKHGKTSVSVRKTSVRLRKTSITVQYTYYQNTHTLPNHPRIWDTNQQQLGWTLPDIVNTVKCSCWLPKTSPETCRAELE